MLPPVKLGIAIGVKARLFPVSTGLVKLGTEETFDVTDNGAVLPPVKLGIAVGVKARLFPVSTGLVRLGTEETFDVTDSGAVLLPVKLGTIGEVEVCVTLLKSPKLGTFALVVDVLLSGLLKLRADEASEAVAVDLESLEGISLAFVL